MYSDTITLFNYHEATATWHSSVINGADIGSTKSSSASRQGVINDDAVTVLIRSTAQKSITTSAGTKGYLGPKEYAACASPDSCITFKPECDFIIEGVWPDPAPIPDGGYESGLYDALNAQRDGVYLITSAAFFGLLPHFEIGGR